MIRRAVLACVIVGGLVAIFLFALDESDDVDYAMGQTVGMAVIAGVSAFLGSKMRRK